jgi:AraC-like DNA-binding protein
VGHLLGTVEAEGEHRLLRSRLAPVLAEALVAPAPDEALPRAVLRALAFLERGFPRPITTRDVAGAAGISVPRLHALFAQWLGQGPGQYLAALRLDHARDRLIRSSEPVAEIALAAGYSEQSAFTRAFRRRFGETPAAFRRRRVQ